MTTHSSILAGESHGQRRLADYQAPLASPGTSPLRLQRGPCPCLSGSLWLQGREITADSPQMG